MSVLRRVQGGWISATALSAPECPQCGARMTSALVQDGDTVDDYVSGWACWVCDEDEN